jgi:hypothetical protein
VAAVEWARSVTTAKSIEAKRVANKWLNKYILQNYADYFQRIEVQVIYCVKAVTPQLFPETLGLRANFGPISVVLLQRYRYLWLPYAPIEEPRRLTSTSLVPRLFIN